MKCTHRFRVVCLKCYVVMRAAFGERSSIIVMKNALDGVVRAHWAQSPSCAGAKTMTEKEVVS